MAHQEHRRRAEMKAVTWKQFKFAWLSSRQKTNKFFNFKLRAKMKWTVRAYRAAPSKHHLPISKSATKKSETGERE
jgi:hypothetical protein